MDQRTLELLRTLQAGSHDAPGLAQIQGLLPEQRRLLSAAEDRATLADLSELLELWGAAAPPELGAVTLREAAAIAEEDLEQAERAVQLYAQSLERAPSELAALASLERLLRGRRDYARLETVLVEHAQRLGATPDVDPTLLASVYLKLGALRVERADEKAPADLAGAIEAYEQALDLAAEPSTLRSLADLYARRGGPDDPTQAADLYCTLAEVLGAGEAIALLERALDQVPEHDAALDLLESLVPASEHDAVLRERWAAYVESSKNEAGTDKRRLSLARAYGASGAHRDALVWLAPLSERGETEALELQADLLRKLQSTPPPSDQPEQAGSEPRPATLVGFRLPPHELAAVASSVKASAAQKPAATDYRRPGGTLVGFQLPPEQAAKLAAIPTRAAEPAPGPAPETKPAPQAKPAPLAAKPATAAAAKPVPRPGPARSAAASSPRTDAVAKPRTNGKSGPGALAASLRSSRAPAAIASRPPTAPQLAPAPQGPAALAAALRNSRAPQPETEPQTGERLMVTGTAEPSPMPMPAVDPTAQTLPTGTAEVLGAAATAPVTPARSSAPPPLRKSASLPPAAALGGALPPPSALVEPSAFESVRPAGKARSGLSVRWLAGGAAVLVVATVSALLLRGSATKETSATGPSRVESVSAAPAAAAPAPAAPTPPPPPAVAPSPPPKPEAKPEPEPSRLQPGQLRVRGGKLSSQQVTLALEDSLAQMERCYDKALGRTPKLAGKVTYAFTVDKAGRPTKVKAQSSTVKDKKLESCSVDAIKKARFPKPAKKKPAQVTWPVTYKKR